jgi:hypothetical protein
MNEVKEEEKNEHFVHSLHFLSSFFMRQRIERERRCDWKRESTGTPVIRDVLQGFGEQQRGTVAPTERRETEREI